MSKLETLTRIPKYKIQWRCSWNDDKQSINIGTLSTSIIRGLYFSISWHSREEIPDRTHAIELNHGSEYEQTHFARVWMHKQLNHNNSCKIVLIHDPLISTPQYPAVQAAVLGTVIGSWVCTFNSMLA